jgi:MFS transporter, SET family, sugar efflux transporter
MSKTFQNAIQNVFNLHVWKRIIQTPNGLLLSVCIGTLGVVLAAISPLTSVAVTDAAGFDKYGIAVFFLINAVFGIILLVVSGYLSDGRIARYKLVLVAGTLAAIGYIGIATISSPIHAYISGVLSVFAGVLFPQLFAVAREGVLGSWTSEEQTVGTTALRTLFSLGFVFGTGITSALTRFMDINQIFLVLAPAMLVLTLFSTYVIWNGSRAEKTKAVTTLPLDQASAPNGAAVGAIREAFNWVPFLLLLAAIVSMRGSDSARSVYLPLAMRNLFKDAGIAPLMFGLTAAAELITMGLVGRIAYKIGNHTTIAIGALIGTLYYVMMALSQSLTVLYLAQVIYAFYVAALMGVGMAYVQSMLANRAGLGSSVYVACLQVGSMVGILGPLVIPGINQTIFFAPAVMCLVGVVILAVSGLLDKRAVRRTQQTETAIATVAKTV